MDATLNQYRKMAYLSYQLIIHFKQLQYTDTETILSMDVKHIHDSHYQLVVFTAQKHLDFITAFRPAFLHLFENFQPNQIYTPPLKSIMKRKNSVTFDERIQVRIILEDHNYDYIL